MPQTHAYMIATIFLALAALYLLCGIIFAVPFVTVGVGRIDPHAVHGSWGFRVLILPGTALLWPLLAKRWLQGRHEPPEENNAHRCAVQSVSKAQN
jgi:hypothetical protein